MLILKNRSPKTVTEIFNTIFSTFDDLCYRLNLEKIKMFNGIYIAVGGVHNKTDKVYDNALEFAISVKQHIQELNQELDSSFRVRIALHIGDIIAGVIDYNKFSYDIWSSDVDMTKKIEATGVNDHIQISEYYFSAINKSLYRFKRRKGVKIGNQKINTYILMEAQGYSALKG